VCARGADFIRPSLASAPPSASPPLKPRVSALGPSLADALSHLFWLPLQAPVATFYPWYLRCPLVHSLHPLPSSLVTPPLAHSSLLLQGAWISMVRGVTPARTYKHAWGRRYAFLWFLRTLTLPTYLLHNTTGSPAWPSSTCLLSRASDLSLPSARQTSRLHRGASTAADCLPAGRSLLVSYQLLLRMLLRAPGHSRANLFTVDT